MKILAIDDDPDILKMLSLILRGGGYPDVTTARSAHEALQIILHAARPFDCLLMDIQMPEMNGIELCQRLRGLPAYAKTPILMLTAMSDKTYLDAALLAGATDFLTKPFEVTELAARIRSAEQIAAAERKAEVASSRAREAASRAIAARRHPLSEPFPLEEVSGLISYPALEQYLRQLSCVHLAGLSLVALRIRDVEDFHAQSSPELYRDTLEDVADTALAALQGMNVVLAHAGYGIFAGLTSTGRISFAAAQSLCGLAPFLHGRKP